MSKFHWTVTQTGPEDYPSRIIHATLFYPGGGVPLVPQSDTGAAGWGRSNTGAVVGELRKPAPTDLNIVFYSVVEKKFYGGSFELPQKAIIQLFKQGFVHPYDGKKETYNELIVGVAPGGSVAVWLIGSARRKEVFFGKAEEVDRPDNTFFDDVAHEYTPAEYAQKMFVRSISPETRAYIKEHGIPVDRWQGYRQTWRWQPKITIPHTPDKIRDVWFYNGETDFYDYPFTSEKAAKPRTVPEYLELTWRPPGRDAQSFEFTFDETEIFQAFAELSKLPNLNGEPLTLHFAVNPTATGYDTKVTLEHPQQVIELTQTKVEVRFSL